MALGCLEEEEVLAADVAGPAGLLLPVGTGVPAQAWVLLALRKGTSFGRPTANIRSGPAARIRHLLRSVFAAQHLRVASSVPRRSPYEKLASGDGGRLAAIETTGGASELTSHVTFHQRPHQGVGEFGPRPQGRHARERPSAEAVATEQIAAGSTDIELELYPCVTQGLLDHFDDRATLGDEMLPRRVLLLNPWLLAPGSEKRRFKRGQSALRTLGCILQLTFP